MLAEGRRRQLHVLLTVVLDACTIAAAFSLAYLLRFFWEVVPASDSPPVGPYLAILPVLVPVWIGVFAAYGLYRERLQGFFDEALRAHPEYGQRPVAFVAGGSHAELDGLRAAGTPPQILTAVRRVGAHRVIIALPADARETTLQVSAACQEAGVPFAIVPDLYTLVSSGAEVELVDRLPLLTLRGTPLAGWGRRLKDALDVTVALVGVILCLPLMAIISLLIVLDSRGPVFYRQQRIGKAAVPFYAWKFRTMVVGADQRLARDRRLRERFAATYKLVDDPRVTRMGRWLRRTSLDELPQLINVLRGEMSLVGPRPIVEEELSKYGAWERRLLCVRPGLTGMWQVLRHHQPDYAQRVSPDMYYIDHWSVGLRLKILLGTLPSVIAGRGAY